MKRYLFIYFCLLFVLSEFSFGQGEIDDSHQIFYRDESTFAIKATSNGLGVNYRYASRLSFLHKTIYDFDLVTFKHPKEYKFPVSDFYFSRRIIYGKQNECINLRAGFGLQNELFTKYDKGGISIRQYFSLGLSSAITKPIYYIIYIRNADNTGTFQVDKFDANQHIDIRDITGKASFFKGLNEMKMYPGIYAKAGFMFEFGPEDKKIHALDVGIITDAFLKKIPIIADSKNNQFFLNLYVSYRFGKVLDVRFKEKVLPLDDLFTQ